MDVLSKLALHISLAKIFQKFFKSVILIHKWLVNIAIRPPGALLQGLLA